MASEKQIAANRANAQRSTGPRSVHERARASANARKHGLTGQAIVIGDEDPTEFDRLREELVTQFGPYSAAEYELVERLAGLFWRLRRVPVVEAGLLQHLGSNPVTGFAALPPLVQEAFEKHFEEQRLRIKMINPRLGGDTLKSVRTPNERACEQENSSADSESTLNLAKAFQKASENHDVLSKLSRYEASLMGSITRTLTVLHTMQAIRKEAEDRQRIMLARSNPTIQEA